MLGTIALIWFAAVPIGFGVCPAIDPPPTSCSASYRAGSGMIATIIVLVLYAVTILAALLSHRTARPLVVAGIVALVLGPFVSYAAVAWSPGFLLPNAAGTGAEAVLSSPTDDPVGQWGEIEEHAAFLTISEDGTVTGSDGCNGTSGTWSITDGRIVFSDMITSLMMCPNLETAMQGPVVTAVAHGDTIYVLDEHDKVTGMLTRAASR